MFIYYSLSGLFIYWRDKTIPIWKCAYKHSMLTCMLLGHRDIVSVDGLITTYC